MPEPPSLPPPLVAPSWRDRVTTAAAAIGLEPARTWRWALAGAAALVVLGVIWFVLAGRSPAAPELTLPRAGSAGDPGGAVTGPTATSAAEATAHAAGAVVRPGVYRLRPGARVTDLLDAAGGPVAEADLDQLNLAATVSDGERVYVPRRGEVPVPAASGGGTAATGGDPAPGRPVDLNRATADQLDALPGVGPATAQAIIDYRTRHGRFTSVDDLLEVRGIGPAKLEQLRPLVKV